MKSILILITLCLLLCLPVMGQDATQEAAQATETATVHDTPQETASQVTSENDALKIVMGVVAGVVIGIAGALAVVAATIRAIMVNPLWMGLAEWLGGKVIPAQVGRGAKGSLNTIGEFIEDVSDGIPEGQKPVSVQTVYSDGTVHDSRTGIFTHPDGSQSHDLVLRKTDGPIPTSKTLTISGSPTSYTVSSSNVEPPQTPN